MRNRLSFFLLLLSLWANSQTIEYAKYLIDTLKSPFFRGRAYCDSADYRTVFFLKNELEKISVDTIFLQPFDIDFNCISCTSLKIDGSAIMPFKDYMILPNSPSINADFKIYKLSAEDFENISKNSFRKKRKFSKYAVLVDTVGVGKSIRKTLYDSIVNSNILNAKIIITYRKSFVWSVERSQKKFVSIVLKDSLRNLIFSKLSIKVCSKMLKNYKTNNLIAKINGSSDTVVLLTAHYDHLGYFGEEIYFPGANDNASGVSMLLNLAKYFRENKPKYSIVFVFFSAEELGLLGSYHFVNNLPFDKTKIRFVVNFDVIGAGDDGIQIVNSTIYKKEFSIIESINNSENLIPKIHMRGQASNSDHYPFFLNKIPSFTIFSKGTYSHYHVPEDLAPPLLLYNQIFELTLKFINNL